MNWFKPKYTVCAECGVHFEPAIGFDERWSRLCAIHRKPVMERDERNNSIMRWARANIERLGEMMDEERAEQQKAADAIVGGKMPIGALLGGQYVKFIGKNPYDNSPFK